MAGVLAAVVRGGAAAGTAGGVAASEGWLRYIDRCFGPSRVSTPLPPASAVVLCAVELEVTVRVRARARVRVRVGVRVS